MGSGDARHSRRAEPDLSDHRKEEVWVAFAPGQHSLETESRGQVFVVG